MSSTSLLRSFRLQQISLPQNIIARRLIIFGPPLILGSFYIGKQLYLYLRKRRKKQSNVNDSRRNFYDTFDHSQVTTPGTNTNSISLNHSDNTDGCLLATIDDHHSSSNHHNQIRSSLLSNKCSYCRSNQKLSFKDSDIFETSLKNLSTTQLIKISLDKLNNVAQTLDEMKIKQNILKEYKVDTTNIDNKIISLHEKLDSMINELESLRNEYMPITYGPINQINDENDGDDFDDQASYISSATTASLGYWDPEPNLHFFQLYQDALNIVDKIKPPKTDRTIITGSENYNDFLAKVHCLRKAFESLFTNQDLRYRYAKIGEEILRIIMDHSLRDSNECIKAYYTFLDFVQNEDNLSTIEMEIEPRNIPLVSFYDIVLDYMLLESFDDIENPPSAVKSIISNQWLSASFREIALQTTISTVMRRKRSKLLVKDGFFEHFYRILDHLSPILAWGFLGTDDNLKFKCESVKDSTHAVVRDYFSFDRCRYTYLDDLCDDIKRVTEERFWELNNKLKILNNS
ncbi:mitoguardin isoform X2 [Dermatophagoides pteronyssinus]|uniref:Mitoguardin n=2 Tax=Dermatophagoides pteronyssinus TaxID=6956 RepID=A0ABQ8IVP0_DERPT|nr:mitoguardin 2-like isoform X2 [Dermatophagoides pteronyssinus]KAH9414383.1 Mitoguardin [Dermatophagoides pteronyssinus]